MIRSIEVRVASLVALGTLAALAIFAWILGTLAEGYARRELEVRLERIAGDLAASLDVSADGTLEILRPLDEAAFDRARSGWYWLVRRGGATIGQSRSTAGRDATALAGSAGEPAAGPFGEPVVTRQRTLANAPDTRVVVAAPLDSIAAEVSAMRWLVVRISAALGVILVLGTTLLIHRALRPLRALVETIEDLGEGRRAQVPATGIANLDSVGGAVNRLHAALVQSAERAHQDAQNLAHAIRTPLSVIALRSEHGGTAPDRDIAAAADLIRRQVDRRLMRAGTAGRLAFGKRATPLRPVLDDAVLVASRVHGQRPIAVELDVPDNPAVDASRDDLDEIFGGLVDNAFRHARSSVAVRVAQRPGLIIVTIHDDGPGIPEDLLRAMPERGRRLDELSLGTGLGLAIARDIASDIGGGLALSNRASPATGLAVVVSLPAG